MQQLHTTVTPKNELCVVKDHMISLTFCEAVADNAPLVGMASKSGAVAPVTTLLKLFN